MALMIVGDFHVVSMRRFPSEANSPLVIDPDAMLTSAPAFEGFKAIAGGSEQILQIIGFVQINHFAPSCLLDIRRKFFGKLAPEDLGRFLVGEILDHALILARGNNIVK